MDYLLQTGLFTVGTKDNIDKSACCIISKAHYYGTSMSLFQFPSSFNGRLERNYQEFVKVPPLRSKKVGELPYFYTDVEEISDPPRAYYFSVSTVNDSDLVSIKKNRKIEWLELISSLNEFIPDSS